MTLSKMFFSQKIQVHKTRNVSQNTWNQWQPRESTLGGAVHYIFFNQIVLQMQKCPSQNLPNLAKANVPVPQRKAKKHK